MWKFEIVGIWTNDDVGRIGKMRLKNHKIRDLWLAVIFIFFVNYKAFEFYRNLRKGKIVENLVKVQKDTICKMYLADWLREN